MPFFRRRPIGQYKCCWGYHSTRAYVKRQRCEKCSGTHEKTECTAEIPKCASCAGPHEATNMNCMARPNRQYGQVTPRTPAELRIVRERGHQDFKAVVAKSEEKGKAPEVTNIPVDKITTFEVISIPEEEMHDRFHRLSK